jgi:hypothetical protein
VKAGGELSAGDRGLPRCLQNRSSEGRCAICEGYRAGWPPGSDCGRESQVATVNRRIGR